MPDSGPSRRQVMIILASSVAVALLAVVILLVARALGGGGGGDGREPVEAPQLSIDSETPAVEDMLLPDPRLEAQYPRPRLLRIPRTQWTSEDIQRFWMDPADISREYLEARAEEQLNRLLGVSAEGELR